MIKTDTKYTYRDLTIVPEKLSMISSRSECNVYYKDKMLPIWTAPMIPIINKHNSAYFRGYGINTIIPRTNNLTEQVELMQSGEWVALSLKQFEYLFLEKNSFKLSKSRIYNICIDIANAHMNKLYTLINDVYDKYYHNLNIMIGNIANPETYKWICDNMRGLIHYIRLGIGAGSGCLTTSNTGVHYPMASLVNECYKIKIDYNDPPLIIADGGIKGYSDVIKALALGADYVMIGGLFANIFESAGEITHNDWLEYDGNGVYCYSRNEEEAIYFDACHPDSEDLKREIINRGELKRWFYGMSTKYAQTLIKTNEDILKTSEGRMFEAEVDYTLAQWVDNMKSYLRSAMSYCGADSLAYFIGQPTLVVNSALAINTVNK